VLRLLPFAIMVAIEITADMTLRELGDWAKMQASRLLAGLDGARVE